MTNYEKAKILLDDGVAEKHYSYDYAGVIVINLEEDLCGYAYPKEKRSEVVKNGSCIWHGDISDDLKKIIRKDLKEFDILQW